MIQFRKHYCAVVLLISCFIHMHGMNRWEVDIDQDDYNAIQMAVCAKKGAAYTISFNAQYPQASKESVIALSKEFDAGSCQGWSEKQPPVSRATINGHQFRISGAIGTIIYNSQK